MYYTCTNVQWTEEVVDCGGCGGEPRTYQRIIIPMLKDYLTLA